VFGERGAAATLADVADRAGVARDALAERYPTEAALREALNEHVLTIAARALVGLDEVGGEDPFGDLAERVTSLMREHPGALLYVARGAIDGDPGGLGLFDAFMAIALARLEELAADGRLDPGLDVEWAALHIVIFNLSTLLFERAIENHLPEPLRSEEGIERWHRADTELFRRGFLRARQLRR
jgi:AcrR family transcriptional regulator